MQKLHLLLISSIFLLYACNSDNSDTLANTPEEQNSDNNIEINISASNLNGNFNLNNTPFPQSVYNNANIQLRDTITNSLIPLAETVEQSYQALLINNAYDIIYSHKDGEAIPLNTNAIINPDITLTEDQQRDINVPMANITPNFKLNGGTFPASVYNRGAFYLQNTSSQEYILLGESHLPPPSINIVAGQYHVIYKHIAGSNVPLNKNATLISNLNIDENTSALNIEVTTDEIRTSFSHNGNAFPVSQYIHAEFYLINHSDSGNDKAFLGHSYAPGNTVMVIAGTYDVLYKHIQGSDIPLNKEKIIQKNFDSSSEFIGLDVNSININVNPTLNGQVFPASQYEQGEIQLLDPETGSSTTLGATHSPMQNLTIIPGIYDINYSHKQGNSVPLNINGRLIQNRNINSSDNINIDIIAHEVSPAFTLNTAACPQSAYDYGNILLRGSQSSADILLSATNDQSGSILILPGTYDIIYQCVNCISMPANTNLTIINDYTINNDGIIAANLQTASIQVSVQLNGAPFPPSIYQSAKIWAGTNADDAVFITNSHTSEENILLAQGQYDFYYQHFNGDQVPVNTWTKVASRQIHAAPN